MANKASAGLSTPLPDPVIVAMRDALHEVAGQTITAVAAEVPGYAALDAQAQATLAQAVELALAGFLALAAEDRDPSAPRDPARDGAYALGRGEARAGRSLDALLAAYRVGARVSWRGLAGAAAGAGLPVAGLVGFAELVFAYIDQLSAASVAGHADELAAEGRLRARHLERLGHGLISGAAPEALAAEAQRAGWTPPARLVAVLLSDEHVDGVLARIDPRTLQPGDDFELQGTGAIWAGVWFTGTNGPEGWTNRIETNPSSPMSSRPQAHPFALLGRFGTEPYFYVGTGLPRRAFRGTAPATLFLRINDNAPANGSGAFRCRVQVWR